MFLYVELSSLSLLYPSLIIQSSNFCLGLPLPLLASILPSIISQFHCLVLIIVYRDLSSSTSFKASSFDICSVQLIFSILRHIHISKASNLVISSFLGVHVSAQYKVTLQISIFTIFFLKHLFNPSLSNSFLLEKASFPIAIFLLISLWHLASSEIMLLTCIVIIIIIIMIIMIIMIMIIMIMIIIIIIIIIMIIMIIMII